jgi:NADP-dependent 3-hydroxy acid dehydrogenase YdfG
MVHISTIRERNARYTKEHSAGLVCVFVGATAGIGAATLERMVQMLDDSTFYVLGRSATKFQAQKSKLESLNTNNKISFIQTEVSLVSGVDDACQLVVEKENEVDYLYMSAGKVPFEGATCTLTSDS